MHDGYLITLLSSVISLVRYVRLPVDGDGMQIYCWSMRISYFAKSHCGEFTILFAFNMATRSFFKIVTLLVLLKAGLTTSDTNTSPSACHCRPVINVSVDGNGQCDLCDGNNQLLQEINDLKKELATIKNQISQIQPGMYK